MRLQVSTYPQSTIKIKIISKNNIASVKVIILLINAVSNIKALKIAIKKSHYTQTSNNQTLCTTQLIREKVLGLQI